MSRLDEIRDFLDPECCVMDEYDAAIVGFDDRGRVVYDYDLMVKCLMDQDGMEEVDAMDWIDYNTIRSLPYMPCPPVILHRMYE